MRITLPGLAALMASWMDVNVALGHWTLSSSTSRSGLESLSCVAAICGIARETDSRRKTNKEILLIVILQLELRDSEPWGGMSGELEYTAQLTQRKERGGKRY